jgi:hypothetical protein
MKSQDEALPAVGIFGLRHFLQQATSNEPKNGSESSFTCVPKTFSRKFFVHFEALEQLRTPGLARSGILEP